MAHAVEQRAVAHGLLDDAWQSVGRADFLLLGSRQDECPADPGLHWMQVPQLAASHFVHPDPFPRRAQVDDLLGDVAQAAQLFARPFEPLGGAGRQIARRLIRLGTLARAQVKVAGPVVSVRLVYGAPKEQARSRGGIDPGKATGRPTAAGPPYARLSPSPA